MLTADQIKSTLANLKQLTFEITDACNLKCKYCGYGEFYNDYDKREDKNLPFEKAVAIIDYLAELWGSEFNMSANKSVYIGFYGGEPLLNFKFIERVVDYIKQKKVLNRTFIFSMTTNAILLDKHMDFIVYNKFSLLISLDGNKEHHGYRVDKAGNNSFDRVMKNIHLLKQKFPKYFDENVNFNAVLHNKNSYEAIFHFIKDELGKIPNISELNNMGIREDMRNEFKKTYQNKQESLMQSEHYDQIQKEMFIMSSSYQNVATFLMKYSNNFFQDYNELLYGNRTSMEPSTGTCSPFSKKMFITVNGKILPCERIGQQFFMGEILDNNEIWLDLEQIAVKHNAYLGKIRHQCMSCKIQRSCIQCVYNLQNLDGNPVCYGHTDPKEFEHYVQSNMVFLNKHPEDYFKILEEVII